MGYKTIKTITGFLFAFLIASIAVSAAVFIPEISISITTAPNRQATGSFHINNTETSFVDVSFSGMVFTCQSDAAEKLNTSISNRTVPANSSTTVQFSVNVPANKYSCIYTGSIIMNSASGSDAVDVSINVTRSPALAIENTSVSIVRNFSNSAILNVGLRNTGNTDLNINFNYSNFTYAGNVLQIGDAGFLAIPYNSEQVLSIPITVTNQPNGNYTSSLRITGDVSVSSTLTASVREAILSLNLPSVTLTSERNKTASATFTITNSGDYDLSGTLTSDAASKYNVQFSPNSFNIAAGASQNVAISLTVPENEETTLHKIGNIIFTSNLLNKSSDLKLNVEGKLRIDEVNVKIDGKSHVKTASQESVDDEKTMPGSKFEVLVEVCNKFTDSDEDISNIDLTATFEGIDDGNDIDGSVNEFDLDGRKCVVKTIDFDKSQIPWLTEAGSYDLIIEIEGTDDFDQTQSDRWTIPVKVYRDEDPNIKIVSASLNPSNISCSRDVSLNVQAYNIGNADDDAVLEIKSSAINLRIFKDFEIGNDVNEDCDAIDNPEDECIGFDKTFNLDISQNLSAGTYPIDIITYYSDTKQSDKKTLNLVVSACKGDSVSAPIASPQPEVPVEIITTPTRTTTAGIPVKIITPEKIDAKEIALLVAANLVVAFIIIYLLSLLIKR